MQIPNEIATREFCGTMNLHFDNIWQRVQAKDINMHKYLMLLDSRTTIKGKLSVNE